MTDFVFTKRFRAVCIGNVIEYFEWSTFSAFSDIIGQQFFDDSAGDETASLLKGLAVFGSGFLMRPLGGIFFGHIGDKYSRETALGLSIFFMLLPSSALILLPSYNSWGVISSIILVILRLMQGLACGGEMVGAMVHTIESAEKAPGYWGGACKATATLGCCLGLGTSAIMRSICSDEQLRSWGWRMCFFVGLIIGLKGVSMRNGMLEESKISEMYNGIDAVVTQASVRSGNKIFSRGMGTGTGTGSSVSISNSNSNDSKSSDSNNSNDILSDDESNREERTYKYLKKSVIHKFSDVVRSPMIIGNSNSNSSNTSFSSSSSFAELTDVSLNTHTNTSTSTGTDTAAGINPAQVPHTHKISIARVIRSSAGAADTTPCTAVVWTSKTETVIAFLFIACWSLGYYTICAWHGYYLTSIELVGSGREDAKILSTSEAWWLIFFSNVLLMILLPLGGMIGDHLQSSHMTSLLKRGGMTDVSLAGLYSKTYGSRRAMILASMLMFFSVPFAYMLLAQGAITACALGQLLLIIPLSIFGGNMPVALCELFPKQARYTGVGLSYNITNAVVAGTAAIVQTKLVLRDSMWSTHDTWLQQGNQSIQGTCNGDVGGVLCAIFILPCKWLWMTLSNIVHEEMHDSRMYPGIYLQFIALIAALSLSIGVYLCHKKQESKALKSMQKQSFSSHGDTGTDGGMSIGMSIIASKASEGDKGESPHNVKYVQIAV